MDRARRRELYNVCDPLESLSPNDARNVELDGFGGAAERPRGVVWADSLALKIEFARSPTFMLFTGLPGSGKTTELRRLMSILARSDGPHMLCVLVDAEQLLDITNPVDIPDLVAPMVHAVERVVLEAEGRDPSDAGREGYLERLWHWLTTTDVEAGKLSIPGAQSLVTELRTRESFRQQVRQIVTTHLSEFLAQARSTLEQLRHRAQACGWRDIVVIYDSIEKLQGISTNWEDVLRSAEVVFGGGAPHLRMPVHTLYTVPIALAVRRNINVTLMPAVKVRDRQGRDFEPGMAALRQLVAHRIPQAEWPEVFGSAAETRVDALIRRSGGYLRELVEMVQGAMIVELPISEHDFERLIHETADRYRRIIQRSNYAWLARVAVDKYLSVEDDDERRASDRLLLANAILRYENNESWFELHPAVADIPGVRAEIERLRQARIDERQGRLGFDDES